MKIKSLLGVCFLIFSLCLSACGFFPNAQNTQEQNSQSVTEKVANGENVSGSEKNSENEKNFSEAEKTSGKVLENGKVLSATEVDVQKQGAYVIIKKSAFTLNVYDTEQKIIFSAPCALGKYPGQKEKRGDMKTPNGTFVIDKIINSGWWTHDFGDGKGEIKGAYGPWFISLDTKKLSKGKWDGIGIHGTHDPASMGTLASEGCIRLKNEDVAHLKKMVRVGIPVTIEE